MIKQEKIILISNKMSFALGNSFKIEDILASDHGKYLTIRKWQWHDYSKLPQGALVGGQSRYAPFESLNKTRPLQYDGVSAKYRGPTSLFKAPLF